MAAIASIISIRRIGLIIGLISLLAIGGSMGLFVYDATGDGLSVGEEMIIHNTDPFVSDTDGDGLTDYEEVTTYGTDPLMLDTDDDGLTDYDEVHEYGTDPTTKDTTNNGFTDYEEVHEYGTDPAVLDTDSDGLDDDAEINRYETDPTTADTDGDGLTDGAEINTHNTDPLQTDTDGDGLTDSEEIREYGTDPTETDTTGDGLSDYAEIHEYGTDPTTKDTNGDGLPDYKEIHKYGTDPTKLDTDEDGISDAASVVGSELNPQLFGDLDPTRKDILLQVEYMEGIEPIPDELSRMQDAFADAPVDNPDGTTGANLHIITASDAIDYERQTGVQAYFDEYHDPKFELKEYGYRHALIVNDATASGKSVRGVTLRRSTGLLVEHKSQKHETGTILMHELGHALGLYNSTHTGIDSANVPLDAYPSVMNYNVFTDCRGTRCSTINSPYRYSTEDEGPRDHDDWGVIEQRINNNIDTSKLEQQARTYLRNNDAP